MPLWIRSIPDGSDVALVHKRREDGGRSTGKQEPRISKSASKADSDPDLWIRTQTYWGSRHDIEPIPQHCLRRPAILLSRFTS